MTLPSLIAVFARGSPRARTLAQPLEALPEQSPRRRGAKRSQRRRRRLGEWAQTFGDEVLAAAILDRLLHDAEVLTINGPSYRLKGRLEALEGSGGDEEEGTK